MRKPFDCVIGVRRSDKASGVGLFNTILARELAVPYLLLKNYAGEGRPLFSLKFEELSADEAAVLARFLERPDSGDHGLFLHTLSGLPLEGFAVERAAAVFSGNDAIHARLDERGVGGRLVRAFAPSLIPDDHRLACRPMSVEFFYFGMAGKVNQARFRTLHAFLEKLGTEYRLLCSLAVHEMSDGQCLHSAREFFSELFGDRFIFLGCLTEMGISYFLNAQTVFIGFYGEGVRANNTTFNTALRFGKRIITNLDPFSPAETRTLESILDIDSATPESLQRFLLQPSNALAEETGAALFTWSELLHILRRPAGAAPPASRLSKFSAVEGSPRVSASANRARPKESHGNRSRRKAPRPKS